MVYAFVETLIPHYFNKKSCYKEINLCPVVPLSFFFFFFSNNFLLQIKDFNVVIHLIASWFGLVRGL